jgi:hypothetical protein
LNVLRPTSSSTTIDLSWLEERGFVSVERREYDWVFTFDGGIPLTAECLWRLLADGVICCTSNDDGQKFGLPAPMDAAAKLDDCLRGCRIVAATMREGSLDLSLTFDNGIALELIPDSCGYEAWQLAREAEFFVAAGQGQVHHFIQHPPESDGTADKR